MNTLARHMNVDAFLDWTPPAEGRWELIDGWPVKMQAEGNMHLRVKGNVLFAVRSRLPSGSPCEIFPDGGAVRIEEATAYVPDAVIDCTVPDGDDSKEYFAPRVVFEVAVTSAARDLGEKRVAYFRRETVTDYVVVLPRERIVYHWRRGALEPEILEETNELALEEPPLRIPVADFLLRV